MKNEEIPSQLWKLKNEVVRNIENLAFSNTAHTDYKSNWDYLGYKMEEIGKEIRELSQKYKQQKED